MSRLLEMGIVGFVGVAPSNKKVIPQCLYPFPYHKVSGRGEQRCVSPARIGLIDQADR